MCIIWSCYQGMTQQQTKHHSLIGLHWVSVFVFLSQVVLFLWCSHSNALCLCLESVFKYSLLALSFTNIDSFTFYPVIRGDKDILYVVRSTSFVVDWSNETYILCLSSYDLWYQTISIVIFMLILIGLCLAIYHHGKSISQHTERKYHTIN